MERRTFLLGAAAAILPAPLRAQEKTIAELDGVADFIMQMREHGFAAEELRALFSQMRVHRRVISLMDAPADPARKTYWREYRKRLLTARRIAEGKKFMRKHETALARAEDEYGAPREILVAILGAETRYGKVLGGFGIARALATLAFAYPRRAQEFQAQLRELLLYTRDSGIAPESLRGSFAGAFGMPQFLPGSARRYAVDFDGDGRADLFSPADAVGSIGSFLKAHGWSRGGALSYPVSDIPDPAPLAAATRDNGYKPLFTRAQLADAGVRAGDIADELYMLVDLENRYDTEYRLGAQNFYTLTRYNKSFKYAAAVSDLAAALRAQ